jgi:hypothetical protein
METIMSKHDDRLEQKSPAKPEISALDDADLEKVTGGEVTFEYGSLSVQYVQQKPDGALDKK